jgi:hypothetical protein
MLSYLNGFDQRIATQRLHKHNNSENCGECFLCGPCRGYIRRLSEKNEGLDIEQIYGHGFQRGPMPGVSVPAGCRQ